MKYLKVELANNFVRDANGNVIEAGFIYPDLWDVHKMNVRAYKGKLGGGAEYCIATTDDETANEMLKDTKVTELQPQVAESLVNTIRAKPDLFIQINPKANIDTVALKNFLNTKNITYHID